jgi:hypothetical protein
MHLMKAIAIFVTSILTSRVIDGLMSVSPPLQAVIDAVLVSVDEAALGDETLDEGLDGLLLHVGKHLDDYLAVALQHSQNRGLLLLKRAPSAAPFEPASSSLTLLLSDRLSLSLMTRNDIHLVALYGS